MSQRDLRPSQPAREDARRAARAGEDLQARFRLARQRHHAAPHRREPVQRDREARRHGDPFQGRRPGDHRGGRGRAADRRGRAFNTAPAYQIGAAARAGGVERSTRRRAARGADLRRGRLSGRGGLHLDRGLPARRHAARDRAEAERGHQPGAEGRRHARAAGCARLRTGRRHHAAVRRLRQDRDSEVGESRTGRKYQSRLDEPVARLEAEVMLSRAL